MTEHAPTLAVSSASGPNACPRSEHEHSSAPGATGLCRCARSGLPQALSRPPETVIDLRERSVVLDAIRVTAE